MESRMVADIKPEIKPEAAEADLPKKEKELKRLQPQTVSPPPKPNTISGNISQNPDEETVVNFGWEEIKNGFIPFVKRGSENYVANHIVAELVYKQIQKEFSKEILFCMAIMMERMSQREADTFNDININHSDKTVVGNYYFKANEFMIRLEYVKKLVNYFDACRKLLLCKIKENNLFGFIQVASENQVPFVWNNDRKLMPLFYFEGQSEYLDARSIDLTDPFKIGYLKFCCKVQKIKKDYYEQNPLKVVDFEDVRKLFPADTTFEVNLPEKVNQDLFAPEVRLALLHEMDKSLEVEVNNNGINLKKTVPEEPFIANSTVESNNQQEYTRAPKRSLQTRKDVEAKRLKMNAAKSTLQSGTFTQEANEKSHTFQCENSLPQLPEARNTNQTPVDFSRLSQDNTVTPVCYQRPRRQQSDSRRNSGLSTITPAASPMNTNHDMPTSSPASNSQITNVPYRSPRSASSPGFAQVNQAINGAAQIVPEYQQTAIASSTEVTNQFKPQETTVRATETYQPVELHERYVAGDGKQQLSCGSSPYYAQRQQTISRQQQSYTYSVQKSFNSSSNTPETTCYQPTALQINSTQINSYQPAPSNATMQFQDLRINQHHLTSRSQREQYANDYWHKLQQQRFQGAQRPMPQQRMQLNGIPPTYANRNFQSHANPAFTGYQTNPSLYRQQYSSGSIPVTQNCIPNFTNPVNGTTSTPAYSFQLQEPNNNYNNDSRRSNIDLTTTALEHPQGMDSVPDFYSIQICVIRGKRLLGISKSPSAHSFLINLSEFVEKVLGLNPFANQTELPSKFKSLYKLNPVQKVQWDRVSREKQLQFVGPLKDVFVEYSEIVP